MMRNPRSAQLGFSIVELMVALTLLAIVLGGVTSLVLSSSRAQTASSKTSVMQAQLRGAFEMLSHDLMTAATGASSGSVVQSWGTPAVVPPQPPGTVLPIVVTEDPVTGTDRIDLITIDPTVSAQLTAAYAIGGAPIQIGIGQDTQFGVADTVMVADLSNAYIVTLNGKGTAGAYPTLNVNAVANPIPSTWPPLAVNSWVLRVRRVAYYINPTQFGPNSPALMFDSDGPGPLAAEPLAEGVEDLQIALGLGAVGSGVIDQWLFSTPGGVMPPNLSQVRAVRFSLVGRIQLNNGASLGHQPTVEDHVAPPIADGMPRRILSSTVAVRNFNL